MSRINLSECQVVPPGSVTVDGVEFERMRSWMRRAVLATRIIEEFESDIHAPGCQCAFCDLFRLLHDVLESIAKDKQREMIRCSQEILELERLADWVRYSGHTIPEDIKSILNNRIWRAYCLR